MIVGTGFDRWKKIYGETDDVNKVQLDIRTGHAQTVEKVLKWFDDEGGAKDASICDCGCGTGSLAVPLALRGAAVTASDISSSMVKEAERQYKQAIADGAAAPKKAPVWEAQDLESASGQFDVVTCLDVMIHYPQVRIVT
jgi:magnesium-protoporphyrin O-methyltransferase